MPVLPLDDLEPLAELIGPARVVAVGESAHFIPEYHELRHRVVRFLHERLGFCSYAHESGFSEGIAVDRWVRGGPGEFPADGFTYRFGQEPELRTMIAWMRGTGRLRYAGLDLPADLASLLPALDSVAGYLATVDPSAGELLDRARREALRWAGPHTMPAFAAYAGLSQSDRDRLTVLLAELTARLDTLRPFAVAATGLRDYETARHELRLAVALDQSLRAQAIGDYAVNVRDAAMFATVEKLLQDGGKVVIGAANNHVQRTPVEAAGLRLPVLGSHLAATLGDDYVSIAVTAVGGTTTTRRPARDDPRGAVVVAVDLREPAPDSLEAAASRGPAPGTGSTGSTESAGSMKTERDAAERAATVIDLRSWRAAKDGPRRMRLMDTETELEVAAAFDLAICLPRISANVPR